MTKKVKSSTLRCNLLINPKEETEQLGRLDGDSIEAQAR